MLKKTLILITAMFISGCGDDSPEPKVSFDKAKENLSNAADKLENKTGDLADSAKDAVGKMGSAAENLAGSAKDAAGNTLDAAGNVVGGAGAAVGDFAGSAKDAAGNALDAAGNVVGGAASTAVGNLAGSAKDAAGNALDAAGNVVGGASTAVGDLAGLAKDATDINLQGVTFKFNSSELESSSFVALDAVARKLDILSNKVEIAGYTDNVGSDAANREISKNRAKAVLNYLSSKGIASDRLSAKGYGSDSPIEDNSTKEGRLANRRVELHVQ